MKINNESINRLSIIVRLIGYLIRLISIYLSLTTSNNVACIFY